MNKFIRLYNQNRIQIWVILLVIIFIFAIIQILNSAYRDNTKAKENQMVAENVNQNVSEESFEEAENYEDESESLVSGEKKEGLNSDRFGKIIDTFIENCMNENYSEAYNLLTEDCKRELYPSEEIFVDQYCKPRFEREKTYDFQLWTSKDRYIYLVKFYDNMLSTGVASNKTYSQDYYSVVNDDGTYKLSINGYIERIPREKEIENENINVLVDYSDIYMDYEIYTITIQNNTEKDILLDTREETDSVYITDENDYNYEALMYEFSEDDLVIKAGQKKDFKLKFSNNYNEGIYMKTITFSKIVKDYQNYTVNSSYNDYIAINIEL